ncbi:Extracellular matrix protein [Aspergillus sp. HF37]|nr:Extracellular matrix protein [Aspergillus sp. HF37]
MHPVRSVLAVVACLTPLVASVAFTDWPTELQTGKPATLEWIGNPNTPVTITLQRGPALNLKDVQVLTADAQGGSFTWVPDDSLAQGSNYAFKIKQESSVNYSGQATILSGSTQTATTTSAPTTEASISTGSTLQHGTQTSSMTITSSKTKDESTSTSTSPQKHKPNSAITTGPTSTASATQTTSAFEAVHAPANNSVQATKPALTAATGISESAASSTSSAGSAAETQMGAGSLQQLSLSLVLGVVGLVAVYNT